MGKEEKENAGMVEPRDAQMEKLKAQLDDWNAELNRLEGEIQKARADVRNRYEIRIKRLREKEAAVKKTLGEIFDVRDEAWDDLKEGVGSAWVSLKSSLKEAKTKFEKSFKEGMEENPGKDG
jgi:DNA anti-recombination protein RmuC